MKDCIPLFCADVIKYPCPSVVTMLVHDDVIKWKHFPRYWPRARGIHRWAVNSPHKGQWRGALMFSLISAWINSWANNHEAGDLIHHRAHYDVTVMLASLFSKRAHWKHVHDSFWTFRSTIKAVLVCSLLFPPRKGQIGKHWLTSAINTSVYIELRWGLSSPTLCYFEPKGSYLNLTWPGDSKWRHRFQYIPWISRICGNSWCWISRMRRCTPDLTCLAQTPLLLAALIALMEDKP